MKLTYGIYWTDKEYDGFRGRRCKFFRELTEMKEYLDELLSDNQIDEIKLKKIEEY